MSAYVFALCHRTVDLVAATAGATLQNALGLGERLIALRRDDLYALEGAEGAAEEWAAACAEHAAWFNPNTHRHAFFRAQAGAVDAARRFAAGASPAPDGGLTWPSPWIGALLHTDRADLSGRRVPWESDRPLAAGRASSDLEAWLALPPEGGAYAVSLAAFDADDPVHPLRGSAWPAPGAEVLPLQLWTLALRANGPKDALQTALEVALTRHRCHGLLIHPHVQGWALAAEVSTLPRSS